MWYMFSGSVYCLAILLSSCVCMFFPLAGLLAYLLCFPLLVHLLPKYLYSCAYIHPFAFAFLTFLFLFLFLLMSDG